VFINFQTLNCVTTGKPATVWCGHLSADVWCCELDDLQPLAITAGHADKETMDAAMSNGPFLGEWKLRDGVLLDVNGFKNEVPVAPQSEHQQ